MKPYTEPLNPRSSNLTSAASSSFDIDHEIAAFLFFFFPSFFSLDHF
uniref:Uncharacterized protein MANES_04G034000 n=1 Tax=Rhizophora mucronata TaxID=61149 RepID=A0A2P2P975_RHIMU